MLQDAPRQQYSLSGSAGLLSDYDVQRAVANAIELQKGDTIWVAKRSRIPQVFTMSIAANPICTDQSPILLSSRAARQRWADCVSRFQPLHNPSGLFPFQQIRIFYGSLNSPCSRGQTAIRISSLVADGAAPIIPSLPPCGRISKRCTVVKCMRYVIIC